jgi:Heterokaryon incompatibility protein (HET)
MRLLSINSDGTFSQTRFANGNIPNSYVILSHTWEADDQEVTLQDINDGSGGDKAGYRKIQFCGDQAKKDGFEYFWVDSCCIDRSSSSELSEALVSMFDWYKSSTRCYVYLLDVSASTTSVSWEAAFRTCKWFTRAWTLQELLAPPLVEFFSAEGNRLGDKKSLEPEICEITSIPVEALRGKPLSSFPLSQRRLWTSNRSATRAEDKAYSLMGIFESFIPPMYGEGEKNAFRRLWKEVDGSRFPVEQLPLTLRLEQDTNIRFTGDIWNSTVRPPCKVSLL